MLDHQIKIYDGNFVRYVNFDNIDRYYSNTDQKKLPIMQKYKLTEKDEMIYYVTSCLRYGNVSKKGFASTVRRVLDCLQTGSGKLWERYEGNSKSPPV